MVPVTNKKRAHVWGDYHFALALKKYFERKNYKTKIVLKDNCDNKNNSDVNLILRGLYPYELDNNKINLMWNISHPDLATIEEYNQYDHVFIASDFYANQLKELLSVPVTPLLQCTDPEIFYPKPSRKYKHDILFVGNTRNIFRKAIKYIFPTNRDLGIYGKGWRNFIPEKSINGIHISNKELNQAYSSCKILLNDHWEDMAEKGFISNRIFDGFASGAFLISDEVKGSEIFKDMLVTYNNKEELNNLIEYYLSNDEERKQKVKNSREMILTNHTFENRVEEIINIINNIN
ncbi:hypothetical protein ALNOE001_14790 [Candidatus Methanobinarius endosymbioticus]|uniref:Spore protein YkvP/CgeB glycosyl transferase-like domain-containing protein n=1 Tax=Candidatus Methanobinarius endosymbioticus TaxID=2006182 RepID=A0A366M9B0_9EURY|nr:hypothetical protein ALNOE001_14790 [Candidatus Methanobinarius endosymbioticus]